MEWCTRFSVLFATIHNAKEQKTSVQRVIKLQTWRFSVQFKVSQNKDVLCISKGFDVVKDGTSLVDTSLVTNVTMGLLLWLY